MTKNQILTRVDIGGRPIPVAEVVVCPVTGQLLLRNEASAVKSGLNVAMYVAKEMPGLKDDGEIPARPATMTHPDVDVKVLR